MLLDTRYEPTVWADGDKVTADRLNKMELAVTKMYENQEPLMVTVSNNKADIKFKEVLDAYMNGRTVLFEMHEYDGTIYYTALNYIGLDNSVGSALRAYTPNGYTLDFVVQNGSIYNNTK